MNGPSGRRENLAELLEQWRNEPTPDAGPSQQPSERRVAGIARALRAVAEGRRRSGRFVRVAAALALAASVLGVAFGGWFMARGGGGEQRAEVTASGVRLVLASGSTLLTDAAGQALSPDAQLAEGAALSTADGSAELVFASGARTRVSERSDVRISEAGMAGREAIHVSRGRVDVEVARRATPVVFSVKTPDALVVVHGTRFSVVVDPLAPGTQTSVAVERGVVAVHARGREVRLMAGERWPMSAPAADAPMEPRGDAPLAPEVSGAPAKEAAAASRQRAAKPRTKSASRRAARQRFASEPQLSEENELFALAMAQKKAGDFSTALGTVEAFLARYPRSVLLQEAEVERFRLLHRLGRKREAARHARKYLGDHRDGYARDEARDIALESH